MSVRLGAVSLLAAVALSAAAAWMFEIPFARAALLAPALLLGLGLSGAVFVLLGRAAAESIRQAKRPRLVIGLILGLVALIVVLTVLGIELPREGA